MDDTRPEYYPGPAPPYSSWWDLSSGLDQAGKGKGKAETPKVRTGALADILLDCSPLLQSSTHGGSPSQFIRLPTLQFLPSKTQSLSIDSYFYAPQEKLPNMAVGLPLPPLPQLPPGQPQTLADQSARAEQVRLDKEKQLAYQQSTVPAGWICCSCDHVNDDLVMICHNDDCNCTRLMGTTHHWLCRECTFLRIPKSGVHEPSAELYQLPQPGDHSPQAENSGDKFDVLLKKKMNKLTLQSLHGTLRHKKDN